MLVALQWTMPCLCVLSGAVAVCAERCCSCVGGSVTLPHVREQNLHVCWSVQLTCIPCLEHWLCVSVACRLLVTLIGASCALGLLVFDKTAGMHTLTELNNVGFL